MKQILFFILFICSIGTSRGQEDSLSAFKKEIFHAGDDSLAYRILYPADFNPKKHYPLLIFLHGAGERGADNTSQLKYVAHWMEDFERLSPSIIIAPQCPTEDYWAKVRRVETPQDPKHKVQFTFFPSDKPTKTMAVLEALTKKWHSEKFIDKNKIYIGGLSMGGMGTYEMLIRKPVSFTAAFVICGGTNILTLKQKIGNVPLWIFHGAEDPIVAVDYARQISATLEAERKEVKYTEYPGVGHDSWLKVFQEPGLAPWLLSHGK